MVPCFGKVECYCSFKPCTNQKWPALNAAIVSILTSVLTHNLRKHKGKFHPLVERESWEMLHLIFKQEGKICLFLAQDKQCFVQIIVRLVLFKELLVWARDAESLMKCNGHFVFSFKHLFNMLSFKGKQAYWLNSFTMSVGSNVFDTMCCKNMF